MKCEICPYENDDKSKFGGHISGHVRRGDLQKRPVIQRTVTCEICHKTFSGKSLGRHVGIHNRNFDELKSATAKKTQLLMERGHRCEKCNNVTWMGEPIPLQMDHIDGNSDNDEKSNLRLLCPNCHAQTPTFGGRNQGKFPDNRRYRVARAWKVRQTNRE